MSVQEVDTNAANAEQSGETDEESASELTEDQIFHVLQNERRRNVLRYLRGTDGPVRMRDVAEQVAAWEHDTTVEALTSNQRQRVYIPLYQSHLPKLDEDGIIDYQQSRGIVERKPLADQLDPYLEADAEISADTDDKWDDYYIGVTGLAGMMLFGAVLELPIFSIVSGMALSVIILLLYTSLTIKKYASNHLSSAD